MNIQQLRISKFHKLKAFGCVKEILGIVTLTLKLLGKVLTTEDDEYSAQHQYENEEILTKIHIVIFDTSFVGKMNDYIFNLFVTHRV